MFQGLAFPSLIPAVFNVTDGNKLPYDPFFFSAVKQENMKDPILSASIDRATVILRFMLHTVRHFLMGIVPQPIIYLSFEDYHRLGRTTSHESVTPPRNNATARFFRALPTDSMDSARGPASPLTETSDVEDDSAPTSPTRLAMWNTVTNPDGEISKSEKRLNKFEDGAGPLLDASKGIITVIKTIGANEEVQMMGKRILSGIPTLMATLKAISTVHPFVAWPWLCPA
ncbi:hypothetical protein C8J57DRAFT_1732541 [Mycena rebaudengoi]|nr:hypothetical protein C8J57DRAFT_1732541 [Mycena rebaudengoi]